MLNIFLKGVITIITFLFSLLVLYIPIWVLAVLFTLTILMHTKFPDNALTKRLKNFLTNNTLTFRYSRAFLLIFLGSYWLSEADTIRNTLIIMLYNGIKLIIGYIAVDTLVNATEKDRLN